MNFSRTRRFYVADKVPAAQLAFTLLFSNNLVFRKNGYNNI